MGKRIVFCADGTWDGTSNNTNVLKLFNATLVSSDQMPFYDNGVGSDGTPIEKLAGGAFGLGLFQKIKDGYTKISQVYEADDELFLFGFSRGAYTARSLAGMIATCGLPTANFDNSMVDTAFDAYRNADKRAALLASLGKYNLYNAKITMVGVWDTVGSLGIPSVIGGVSPILYGFLDTTLHADVLNAIQALAIDERRVEFPPTLWTGNPSPGQTVEQVWFCGCHSDVGGGTTPAEQDSGTALSDITLAWMMSKATALGVQFAQAAVAKYVIPAASKYALDQINESWSPMWGFPIPRKIAPNVPLSNSVAMRCQHVTTYRPSNLKFEDEALGRDYASVATVG